MCEELLIMQFGYYFLEKSIWDIGLIGMGYKDI